MVHRRLFYAFDRWAGRSEGHSERSARRQQLREKAPVYRMPETGFYVISNYEDLKTVLSDPATFSNDIEIEQLAGEAAADLGRMFDDHLAEVGWGHVQTLQRTDPPVHGRYRRLINRTLTPPMVKAIQLISEDLGYEKARPLSKLEDMIFKF